MCAHHSGFSGSLKKRPQLKNALKVCRWAGSAPWSLSGGGAGGLAGAVTIEAAAGRSRSRRCRVCARWAGRGRGGRRLGRSAGDFGVAPCLCWCLLHVEARGRPAGSGWLGANGLRTKKGPHLRGASLRSLLKIRVAPLDTISDSRNGCATPRMSAAGCLANRR